LGTKWKIFYWDYSSGKRRGRTKSWAKSLVPTRTEAQRSADQFMETANGRNNEPQLFPSGEQTMAGLVATYREKIWPLLKNSTRISYDFYLDTYLLPKWGSMKLTKMRTIELQDFFNSSFPRLAPKTIRNMRGCMRAVFNQGKAWGLLTANPAQGVCLPRKRARKPPVVLAKQDIRLVIDALPEPTKSIVTLVIVGSLRIGEVAALRWGRIHPDRIEVVERFYYFGSLVAKNSREPSWRRQSKSANGSLQESLRETTPELILRCLSKATVIPTWRSIRRQ
jgi:integrase